MHAGKVELHAMPEAPPPYLRFMRLRPPSRAMIDESPTYPVALDTETILVDRHRVSGLSISVAYWPDSWQDSWAIEELLKWEGRENEIRHERYYADFIVDENQQARENKSHKLESESVRGSRSNDRPVVLVVHESVHRRDMDARTDVLERSKSNDHPRLERGVSGRYATDLSGKDGE